MSRSVSNSVRTPETHPLIAQRGDRRWFVDGRGRKLEIRDGFAAGIFRGDRAMVTSATGYAGVVGHLAGDMAGVRNRVGLGLHTLKLCGVQASGRESLVVGASDGRECLWLAHETGGRVTGIDVEPATRPNDEAIRGLGACVGTIDEEDLLRRVELRREDACRMAFADQTFDAVFSWQTFEHVMDPGAALREIRRVLRVGGLAFLEYNPFFSIDGAHWAATIDVPWAHARLDGPDLAIAVDLLHLDPQPWAATFVQTGINRLCLADLRRAAAEAGLEVVALLPRLRTEDLLLLDPSVADEIRGRYPRAELMDLGSRIVRVVLRRR